MPNMYACLSLFPGLNIRISSINVIIPNSYLSALVPYFQFGCVCRTMAVRWEMTTAWTLTTNIHPSIPMTLVGWDDQAHKLPDFSDYFWWKIASTIVGNRSKLRARALHSRAGIYPGADSWQGRTCQQCLCIVTKGLESTEDEQYVNEWGRCHAVY